MDGLPVPPPRLRFTTCENADLDAFIHGGRATARVVSERASAQGNEMDELEAMLDFGCGCGRVARHWAGLRAPEVHGCDSNPELVGWCRDNLPFMRCVRNELNPPLPYEGSRFDLVYAISVFTHLPIALQCAWVRELSRILRPGGLLLLTFHGDRHAARYLLPWELRRYRAGEPVVLYGRLPGTRCAAFDPPAYVTGGLLRGLTLRSFASSDEVPELSQDLYLAQRIDAEPHS